ncbi:MAG: flagellar hook-associated protein FlgK, partial [Deltaproteobacteria bacterium]|nr:flagellar hook-associated protein FlgK [Deltaproteobacteria bacterium]
MGISSSMYVALTGMYVSQAAMETASHNIANVNTPGYSRQRVNLSTLYAQSQSYGQIGLGAQVDNVMRYHDQFLTRSLITTGSALGFGVGLKSALDNLELFFNESQGGGINEAANNFFASWDQLADEAGSRPVREELIQNVQSLAKQLALRRTDLDALRLDTNKRIDDAVKEVNTLIEEIASLNQQITAIEDPTLNRQANDLRDTRDEKTRELAEYMNIEFYEDPHDGQWTITSSAGIPLVLKERTFPLTTSSKSNGDVSIRTTHNQYWLEDISHSITEGAIGGWLNFRDVVLDDVYKQYDSYVDGLIFAINDQHAQGAGLSMLTETQASSLISNRSYAQVDFPGDDNTIRFSSLVPHLASQEPYGPYSDPDNLTVRFKKSSVITSEITSEVKFNDDPAIMKWEITFTLPTDSNGNVTVTARQLCDYINSQRSQSSSDGQNYLPPRTSQWLAGDFISAEAIINEGDSGRINFDGPIYPPAKDRDFQFTRQLQYVLPQGHHLSYGSETASLATALKHTDNDLTFTAVQKGDSGERIAVEYLDNGPNRNFELKIIDEESGTEITDPSKVPADRRILISVQLATDANGQILTTAGDIAAAVSGHFVARTLVSCETPQDESGLGLVTEMDKTYLDRSGYFTIVTYPEGEEPVFHRVTVNPDDTMEDIVKQIGTTFGEGIPGLRLEAITDRHGQDTIRLIADDNIQFGFAGDSSGALAVLGLNTLLTGKNAADIGVSQKVLDNLDLLNAGHIDSNGVMASGDNTNALNMADVKDKRFSFYHQSSATLGTEFNSSYTNIGARAQAATRNEEVTDNIYTQL